MVVVAAVDSVRWLHCHVAIDDANQWWRRGLGHSAVEEKKRQIG